MAERLLAELGRPAPPHVIVDYDPDDDPDALTLRLDELPEDAIPTEDDEHMVIIRLPRGHVVDVSEAMSRWLDFTAPDGDGLGDKGGGAPDDEASILLDLSRTEPIDDDLVCTLCKGHRPEHAESCPWARAVQLVGQGYRASRL